MATSRRIYPGTTVIHEVAQPKLFTLAAPNMARLDLDRCEARPIPYKTAARIVADYHYLHSVPSIAVAVGLFVDGTLAGCLTYGTFPRSNAEAICGPGYADGALELTRLYLHDWAGRNSESWLIGQSFAILKELRPLPILLISYADSAQGHVGTIYQATNWLYTGASTHCHYRLRDGTIIHSRSAWNPKAGETAKDFYKANPGARPVQGPPKHRYVYFVGTRAQRKQMRQDLRWPVLPYPKGA